MAGRSALLACEFGCAVTLTDAAAKLLASGDADHHPAGAIIGVRTAGGTDVATSGWGSLRSGGSDRVPLARGVRLDLASVTKVAATTVLTMLLVADGRLQLETPAGRYLPAFRGDGKDAVTLEQLLTHTAGLQPWWPLYLETTDRAAALERAATLPLAAAPGSEWRYSDLGLMLAGQVIEKVVGEGLADAFRRLVAVPLGLRAGYGPVPAADAAATSDSDAYEYAMIATGIPYPVPFAPDQFAGWRDRPLRGEVNDGNAAHALGGVSGHAGLFATVDELLVLGSALRGGGFVPAAVLERFSRPSAVEPSQAVGFRRGTHATAAGELTLLNHGGFTGTWFGIGIEQELVVAGGALRLLGNVGRLPVGAPREPRGLATGVEIQAVMRQAALDALSLTSLEAR